MLWQSKFSHSVRDLKMLKWHLINAKGKIPLGFKLPWESSSLSSPPTLTQKACLPSNILQEGSLTKKGCTSTSRESYLGDNCCDFQAQDTFWGMKGVLPSVPDFWEQSSECSMGGWDRECTDGRWLWLSPDSGCSWGQGDGSDLELLCGGN